MPARTTDLTPLGRGGGAGRTTKQQRPITARGVVALAPGAETAAMVVTVNWRGKTIGEIIPAGNWSPRGTALPVVGDVCLVVYDDEGDAFVPVWDGTTALALTKAEVLATGLAASDLGFAVGTASLAFASSTASSNTTVTHGLGHVPSIVVATPINAPGFGQIPSINLFTLTTTTFGANGDINVAYNGSISFFWLAK